jgi:hypothetical protein
MELEEKAVYAGGASRTRQRKDVIAQTSRRVVAGRTGQPDYVRYVEENGVSETPQRNERTGVEDDVTVPESRTSLRYQDFAVSGGFDLPERYRDLFRFKELSFFDVYRLTRRGQSQRKLRLLRQVSR